MNISPQNEDARFLDLLAKWQSGDFTRTDERELFALAAKDPFRSEALEGFLAIPEQDHTDTLHRLEEKIRGNKRSKRVFLPQILAIAAALALLIGVIWFFNSNPVPANTDQIAQNSNTVPEVSAPETPTSTSAPQIRPNSEIITENASPSRALDKTVSQKVKDQYTDVSQDQGVAFADTISRQSVGMIPGQSDMRSTNRVTRAEEAEMAAVEKKAMPAAPAKSQPIIAADDADKAKAKAGKRATTAASPVGGWDAFRQYLNTNARLTDSAKANNITGTVRLQFKLDANNNPYDFKVLNGLGYGCDEVAIRLVKARSWQSALDDVPVVVDVSFIR